MLLNEIKYYYDGGQMVTGISSAFISWHSAIRKRFPAPPRLYVFTHLLNQSGPILLNGSQSVITI